MTTQWGFSSTGDEVMQAFGGSFKGKTAIITGPSHGGIGAATALQLASASPALLILTGRSEAKITPVIDDIRTRYPSVPVKFIRIDLSSQNSVRRAAAEINNDAAVDKIDLLINNAAIMACPYAVTEDGIESQFATNHVGHFLLTNLIMAKILRAGDGARVVNVSSSAHMSGMQWDDVNFQGGGTYEPWAAYGQSKMANIIFSRALAQKLRSKGISSFSLHPGSIMTNLQVHMNAAPGGREAAIEKARAKAELEEREFVMPKLKTTQQGCATTLVAALDPTIESRSGSYLVDGDIAPVQPDAKEGDEERLWVLSEGLVGEKFDL